MLSRGVVMGSTFRTGRDREIAEIVRAKRAALVGRLLLGELNRPLERIFPDSFANWPRLKLRRQRDVIRAELRGEIAKFCRRNFSGLNEHKLADLYSILWERGGKWRMPLVEFQARFGAPNDGVLRGAPLHATVCISHWGLQTEYPEHHLSMDLAEAVNSLIGARSELTAIEAGMPTWSEAKRDRQKIGSLQTRIKLDSMPAALVKQWFADRDRWLRAHAIDPAQQNWREKLRELDRRLVSAFLETFWNRWQDALDDCHGARVLRTPEIAEIVANSLRHFDGDRYLLFDFVVMPNHVHLLASFPDEDAMLAQCESWKHFTATQINRVLKQRGRFWQQDGFDHLVRNDEQFAYLRRYIADNPEKAGLREGEFKRYSRKL
jgi:putative transposase